MLRKACKAVAAATVFAGLTLSAASAGETNAIAGMWQVRAMYTEDVATNERHDVYGSHPTGTMQTWPDGHFNAYIRSNEPALVASVWEDVAYSVMPDSARAIFYGGTYRIDGQALFIHVTNVQHQGPVGTDAFDLSWNEGRTRAEEQRLFQLVTAADRTDRLSIATMPMPNPNGAGNTIVGRIVWERISD
jgi:hypothetical protein